MQSYHHYIEVLFKRAWLQKLRLDKPIQTHTILISVLFISNITENKGDSMSFKATALWYSKFQ